MTCFKFLCVCAQLLIVFKVEWLRLQLYWCRGLQ